MMYSPDIPTTSPRAGASSVGAAARPTETSRQSSDAQFAAFENYFAKIESEESVKCVVSSLLFCLVLLAFFLVAILINPEM